MHDDCNAADLFRTIWEAMVDVLGTPATATLMRRSVKQAAARRDDLDGIVVRRSGFDYDYKLPEAWSGPRSECVAAVREITRELSPLLVELTGSVVLRRLRAIPELTRCELFLAEQAR